MEWWLPVIWAGVIGFAVMMYVILDGFDLGIGILFPFTRSEDEREQMMRSIAPLTSVHARSCRGSHLPPSIVSMKWRSTESPSASATL